jgi:basic membrane lipoprotein Med (substrate-binding protein (PBP1-ABC) superfamily)
MKSKWLVLLLVCMLSVTLVLGGCGGGGQEGDSQAPAQSSSDSGDSGDDAAPLKAALLTSGPVNDGGWNNVEKIFYIVGSLYSGGSISLEFLA